MSRASLACIEDGAWISLVSPVADLPLQAIVQAVDPHLGAEVVGYGV